MGGYSYIDFGRRAVTMAQPGFLGRLGLGRFVLGLNFLNHCRIFDLVVFKMVTYVFDIVVGGEVTRPFAIGIENMRIGPSIQEPDTYGFTVDPGGLMKGGFLTGGTEIDIDPGLEEGLEDPDIPPPGGVVDGRPPVPGIGPVGRALRVLQETECQTDIPEIASIEEFEAELVPGGEFGREGHRVWVLYPPSISTFYIVWLE